VYSEADCGLPYVSQADESYPLGGSIPADSYLNQPLLLDIAKRSGCDAVHPGYGFLSENPAFARSVGEIGACFVGPSPRWIEAMGNKVNARRLMAQHGMPMAASSGLLETDVSESAETMRVVMARLGYPVLVKPANGGGGIGMLPVRCEEELLPAIARSRELSMRGFGNADVYLEQLVERPRHIEFQVLADRYGAVRVLFERDCSVQRRHQKVIEEAPAPGLSRNLLETMSQRIQTILSSLRYDVIGTVEMLYDPATQAFQFLEMNTRLQVEHAVTEEVTGVDVVSAQLRLAAGEPLDRVLPARLECHGHAIEARLYAEDPVRFFPSTGVLETFRMPDGPGVRVETGFCTGVRVTPYYDPLLAKIVVHHRSRDLAIERLKAALCATEVRGLKTNLPFLKAVLNAPEFARGDLHTGLATTANLASTLPSLH
jgi:acetyl-CoA carboxylase biotin carboxylase subunit